FIAVKNRERAEQLKAANKELEKTQTVASLGIAVAKIIHEIAQPLNALLTTLQLHEGYLKKERERPDQQTETFMADMRGEINRLRELLNELREFSRPSNLKLSSVSLPALVRGLDLEKLVKENPKPVTVKQQFSEDLPQIMADREKLKAMLLNLSKNAIEA